MTPTTGTTTEPTTETASQEAPVRKRRREKPYNVVRNRNFLCASNLSHEEFLQFATARYFTTGHMARIFGVAPRTVSKWFDAGLIKGYRLPLSNDRRVTRLSLMNFILDNGFGQSFEEIMKIMTPSIKFCGDFSNDLRDYIEGRMRDSGIAVTWDTSVFDIGTAIYKSPPLAAVVSGSFGLTQMKDIAIKLRGIIPSCFLIALLPQDQGDKESETRETNTFDVVRSDNGGNYVETVMDDIESYMRKIGAWKIDQE